MKRQKTKVVSKLRGPLGSKIPSFIVWPTIFAVAGVALLVAVRAASPFVSVEPETAVVASGAIVGTDANASNGQFVTFKAPPPSGATGRCQHTTTRICYNAQQWYINGVNMPWRQWPYAQGAGDFGGGNGTGVIANRTEISNRLAGFKNTGSNVVRWWMFQGGAWQINRDASGKPTSLNTAVYADMDAALELAQQHNLYYNFTLFGGMEDGQMPRVWRTNTTYRQDLANVLAPMFARYKDNPRVMSWEIWNEPEWQYWNGIDGATKEQATDMAKRIVAQIRANAPKAMTTVGQALINSLVDWKDVDLDFDSPHWYDPHTGSDVNALTTTAAAQQAKHGTSRPIIIGEYPMVGNTSQNLTRLNEWYNRGYAGAWAWSLFNEQTGDNIVVDLAAMTTFGQQHTGIGPE